MSFHGIIVRNCDVYMPEHHGVTDITLLNGKVFSLEKGAWKGLHGLNGLFAANRGKINVQSAASEKY